MTRRRRGICQSQEREGIALAPVGHEHLGAGDEVAVATSLGDGADGLDVRAGVRLGQAEAPSREAGSEARQQALLLLVRSMLEDDQRRHGMAVDDAHQRHEAAADLLDDARIGRDVETEAAVLLRHQRAEETHVPHSRDQVVRIGVGMFEG